MYSSLIHTVRLNIHNMAARRTRRAKNVLNETASIYVPLASFSHIKRTCPIRTYPTSGDDVEMLLRLIERHAHGNWLSSWQPDRDVYRRVRL